MSSFSRGRFTRLVPLVLVALCLLLVFSLQISPSTQSAKSPIDKDTAVKNDHAADEQRQKERERMIDSRRTVIEPGMLN